MILDRLLRAPRFMRKIVDFMGDGLFILDNTGNIVFWNRSMARISGYTKEDVIGESCALIKCSRCFGKKCPPGIDACGILRQGGEELKECTLQHKNGYDIPVIKNASVVRDEDGTILGIVETVTDLTALHRIRLKAAEMERRSGNISRLGSIIGRSRQMQEIYTLIKAAAGSDATVLIQGESGTGKELVASAIHAAGHRKDAAMVTVNCAALPENLLESELFGHVRGAFTGAVNPRIGRFEAAHGGTVFLDEVDELSPYIQIKLLRVLQEREINRVGENHGRRIDIRVIAATHQDLYDAVKAGTFREDLYYRLKVFPIRLPPLRRRRQDTPLLIDHFLRQQNRKTGKRIRGVSVQAMRLMMDYAWPGNIRELKNAIEHAFVICGGDMIELEDLPLEIRDPACHPPMRVVKTVTRPRRRRKPTKRQLVVWLEAMAWNKAEVARRTGLSRTSIWKYMKEYGIPLKPPEDDRSAPRKTDGTINA
jgi:two-component system, NtrC family, response regulator HydG